MKKESKLFDVTMGAYDGAEVRELVSSFLLFNFQIYMIKKTSAYIEMTAWQFSKTTVVHKQRE